MAFRNVVVESAAHLSVKGDLLVIRTDREHTLAIEDISALLIENRQSTITAAALSRLGQSGCSVFFCDEKHIPCAVLQPFMQHSRALSVLKLQLAATEPTKKRIWQRIVKAKIENQAICLDLHEKKEDARYLRTLVDRVTSGDGENLEATAARRYFRALFGAGFARSDDNGFNAALNYGYAILRGCMARCLTVHGFLPALGVHHKSELNSFNLADDMMEPFRPLIDNLVAQQFTDEPLTTETKHILFNTLNMDILSGNQHHSVAYAIERMAQSLYSALESGAQSLCLPTLLDIAQHRYE